jgi:hypothetical protein
MRKPDPASAAEAKALLPDRRADAPVQLVCLAMALSLFVLGCRIASIW